MSSGKNSGGNIEAQFQGQLGSFSLDIGFQCPMRGISALFGASGSGKTTLLRLIAGLQRMRGRLSVDGEVWQDDHANVFRFPYQRQIGYVFQEASLFPHLSVLKNLSFGFNRIPSRDRKVKLDDAIELLGLSSLVSRMPNQLSGGQRQRVGIARALLTSPKLMLMDEPMSALDQNSKQEIMPYLERMHEELSMPVLYVSHTASEIARLADYLIIVDKGQVRAAGPLLELYSRSDLARARGNEADTIINACISEHDDHFHLSYLDFSGGRFAIPRLAHDPGFVTRLRILANDVSITLQAQTDTSILNIFPANLISLEEDGPAKLLLNLNISGTALLARITRKSAHTLALKPGMTVYAQIKAVALLD